MSLHLKSKLFGDLSMKKNFSFKAPITMSAILLFSAVNLTGCSGDYDDNSEETPVAEEQTKAMDIKPAEAPSTEKQPLVEVPKVEEAQKVIEEKVEEVTEAVTETKKEVTTKVEQVANVATKPSGQSAYSTCVGCHGASGEGGVGPRLNNQTVEAIVTKLQQYKAGEQVGPMTGMMAPMAMPLSTEDMQVIAEYITAK